MKGIIKNMSFLYLAKREIKYVFSLCIVILTLLAIDINAVHAASNPYPTTQDVDGDGNYEIPCTYFAWQQVYENLGIALPAWGNAVNWWQSAMNAGYAVGSEPRAGAIAVWSGDTFGHVAYVVSGSGNTFVVNEGGRTDLDHTSSHGVVYGYEITNAVGGARPWDSGKKLLGFIYPVAEPPSNPQIALGQYWFDLADNVYVKVSADRAVSYFGALYKEGVRIWEGSIINGVLEFPATQFGVGRYSVYASCSNASGSIDTPWADFSVVAEAGYSGVSVSKRHYELNDIVSISVSTVCAHGQVIGIDKEGEGRIYTADTVSPYTIKADSLGKGNYSAYFSVYNHHGGVDTETLQSKVGLIPRCSAS